MSGVARFRVPGAGLPSGTTLLALEFHAKLKALGVPKKANETLTFPKTNGKAANTIWCPSGERSRRRGYIHPPLEPGCLRRGHLFGAPILMMDAPHAS